MKIFGYASTFNDVDEHKDIVCKGAFEKTLLNWNSKKTLPPMLYNHSINIGHFEVMKETDYGLWVEGRIKGYSLGRNIDQTIKNKTIQFFSIGFKPVKYNQKFFAHKMFTNSAFVRVLKEIDLIEVSVVKTPANANAKIMME